MYTLSSYLGINPEVNFQLSQHSVYLAVYSLVAQHVQVAYFQSWLDLVQVP